MSDDLNDPLDTTPLPEPSVTDIAGDLEIPWTTTVTTDPEVEKASRQRIDRAVSKAKHAKPYKCPRCGRTLPGVNLRGEPRRACTSPKCYGAFRHDESIRWMESKRDTTPPDRPLRINDLSPQQVLAIREAYEPGVRGYGQVAREFGVHRMTVAPPAATVGHRRGPPRPHEVHGPAQRAHRPGR